MSERTTYEYIEAVKEIGKLKEQLDTQRQRIAELEANLAESLRIIDDRKTLNDRHMGRIAELEVERDAANATIDSLMEQRKKGKSGTAHCLYCGYTGERKPIAEATAETLGHGRTCEKHPMREIERENVALRAKLDIETLRPYHDSSFFDPPSYHEPDITTLWDCPQCVERFIERAITKEQPR